MSANRFFLVFVLAVLVVGAALFVRDSQTKIGNSSVTDSTFHTPPMSNYIPAVPTPGWRTPKTSNYAPNNPVGGPG